MPSSSKVFETIQALQDLGHKSYFELPSKEARRLETVPSLTPGGGRLIEAWTFVLHPQAIEAFVGAAPSPHRYILTIDTLRAKVYYEVRKFLQDRTVNVCSYYSGGWADFVCDVFLTDSQLHLFLEGLDDALHEGGAHSLCQTGNPLKELVTVWRVKRPIILCSRVLEDLGSPTSEALDLISQDKAKFEQVYRNYRSTETTKLFVSEKELKKYLRRLKSGNAIVCYRVITDFSRHLHRDYVPLCNGHLVIDTLMRAAKKDRRLLEPVIDMFEVSPHSVADKEESSVSHIFLTHTQYPGQSRDWKELVYQKGGDHLNVYSYPLEGTVNESPFYLSTVPEFINAVRKYDSMDGAFIGWAAHPLLPPNSIPVRLPRPGFGYHGVILGGTNSGKTNTALVLISSAMTLPGIDRVVLIDCTGGVDAKLPTLPPDVLNKLTSHSLTKSNGTAALETTIHEVLTTEGLFYLKPDADTAGAVLDALLTHIPNLDDNTPPNEPRKVSGLIVIEEIGSLLGADELERRRRIESLLEKLDLAWRKGLSIWLSTQAPSKLGFDNDSSSRLLVGLKSRIIHRLAVNDTDYDLVRQVSRREGLPPEQMDIVEAALVEPVEHRPLVRGVALESGRPNLLPPVFVSTPALHGAKLA